MSEADNKNDAVWKWLFQNEQIKRLYFNFSDTENGNVVIATTAGNNALKTYVDGSKLKAYDFSLIQYLPLNTVDVNSNENAEIMFDAEQLMGWVEEQNKIRNFPYFPNNSVTKVENLHNMPNVAGMDDTKAKYLFGVRITYLERAK